MSSPSRNIEELLNSRIDAVYIASPVNVHAEHITLSVKSRKHVLCEKPLGMTVREAQKIVRISNKNGIYLGTGFMMRFLAQHQAALKLIRDGKLGKPVYGRTLLSCWYPPIDRAWRQNPETGDGGSLLDMGSHCIDLLELYFGKIKRVSCFINNTVHSYRSEDSAVVLLYFENGALATVDAFFCIPDKGSKNSLELYGSKRSIIAKGTFGQGDSGEITAFPEDDNTGYDAQQAGDTGDGLIINPRPVNTYYAEIDEFSLSILEKREPSNNFTIGLANQKILAACYKSALLGKVVNI